MESAPTMFYGTNLRIVGDAGPYNAVIIEIAIIYRFRIPISRIRWQLSQKASQISRV